MTLTEARRVVGIKGAATSTTSISNITECVAKLQAASVKVAAENGGDITVIFIMIIISE